MSASATRWDPWDSIRTDSAEYKGLRLACDNVFSHESIPPNSFSWLKHYIALQKKCITGHIAGLYCSRNTGNIPESMVLSEMDRAITTNQLEEEEM